MILGIGVDSIEISRVVKAMEKEYFGHRIFTEKERSEWIQGHLWSINWVFNHTRSKVFVFLRIMGKRKMEQ